MSRIENEDTSKFPVLGRVLAGIDSKRSVNLIVKGLYGLCALLFAADFIYEKHTTLAIEDIPGFYALYGFIMCAGLVIVARGMRTFLKRPEDYYAPKDIESEDYPIDQLEKVENDA